jgi:phosphotransferase system enzyme I (PtsI)
MNEKIAYLYNPYNPALIRLIKMVIDNGHKAGIWVGLCGELAGDSAIIPLLLGLGLDEFSMSPLSILASRKLLSVLSKSECEEMAKEALKRKSSDELKKFVLSRA